MFSIAQDRRTEQQHYQVAWAHNAGLPVVVSLLPDAKLGVEPVPELASLRDEQLVSFSDSSLDEANQRLEGVGGDLLEIQVALEADDASRFGIKVRRSRDGAEETSLAYDSVDCLFSVDRTSSTLNPDVRKGVQGGPLALDDGVLKLHIFVDRSMLEEYANGRKSITTRIYPTRPDATGLQVWADGSVTVKSMDVWRLTSAYGETVPAYYPEQKPVPDHGALPNHSFQSCDLTGWIDVEGEAFTDDHVTGAEDWGWGGPFRQAEDGTNSYHLRGVHDLHDGDDAEGVLRSQTFTLRGGGQIDCLISGGRRSEELYVALVRASDGEILVRATGHDSEQYRRVRWDASKHLGEELYVEILDQASGGWGHLNLDDINVPTEETCGEVAVATTATPEPEASREEVKPTATEEVAATDQLVDEERAKGSSAPTRWLPILVAVVAAVVAIVVAVILLRHRHRP